MNPTSQTDNFCFQCHKGTGSVQVGGITNYTYSKNFGGGTATFTNIYDAFNSTGTYASSHNLADVLTRATQAWSTTFTSTTNACIACHNPHTAQKNYPVTVNTMGGVNTAIRRPGDYKIDDYNLWGDEPNATSGFNEMMSDWTANYQAPYCVGGTYEPACNSTSDGSNLPNFVVSCRTGCHRNNTTYSTERGRNLYAINWTNDINEPGIRSVHGKFQHTGNNNGTVIAPYTEGVNYVLSCTDCHEPHGSQNKWLIRSTVNGKAINPGIDMNENRFWTLCTACHVMTTAISYHVHDNYLSCNMCHRHGVGSEGEAI
jgi:hypothetical protein